MEIVPASQYGDSTRSGCGAYALVQKRAIREFQAAIAQQRAETLVNYVLARRRALGEMASVVVSHMLVLLVLAPGDRCSVSMHLLFGPRDGVVVLGQAHGLPERCRRARYRQLHFQLAAGLAGKKMFF